MVVKKKVTKKKTAVPKTKSPAKKTVKKSKMKPKSKQIKSSKASGEERFFLIDGSVVHDVFELANAFDNMTHEVFYHHVNDFKNDFSNWVREVMKEPDLADKLMLQNNPDRCQITILRHFIK